MNSSRLRFPLFADALLNALLHMFVAFKRTWELKLFSVLMGGQLLSATWLCTLVSPSLPCASCRSVVRLEATEFLSAWSRIFDHGREQHVPLLNTTVYVGVTIFAKRLDFLSVSCSSDGNLSYTYVSRAQISSEVRHYCVSDGTHCSADVCCAKSLFPPFKSNTKCDVIIRKHLSQNDVLSSGAHDEGHDGVSSVHAEDHGGCSTKRFHCAEVLPT